MKILLVHSISLNEKNDIPFPVFGIIPDEIFQDIRGNLPWYQIVGEKDLIEASGIDRNFVFENYKKVFFSQPEHLKEKLNIKLLWNIYTDNIDKLFFEDKTIQDQLMDALNNPSIIIDPKERLFRNLLIKVSSWAGDITGSLIFTELDNKTSYFYKTSMSKSKFLEKDWKDIYKKGSDLLRLICPDYNIFLRAVKETFGTINVSIEKSGKTKKYTPKTDLYGSKEMVKLMEFIESSGVFKMKLKRVCDIILNPSNPIDLKDLDWLPNSIKEPLDRLGPERIKALGYNLSEIQEEILYLDLELTIKNEALKKFRLGERYPRWYIKEFLNKLAKELGCKKTFTATHILNFFEVEKCWIGKKEDQRRGYKIIKIKS